MSDREKMLERLEDVHSFPGEYTFKVIGSNSPEFVSQVVQAAINVVGKAADPDVDTRESSKGNHLSVTLTVTVQEADAVMDIYAAFQEMEEVRFIL
ncbi:MAG: YbeD family protein [Myxococcota bacterium]